jgi:large subunit ribosomal protein L3
MTLGVVGRKLGMTRVFTDAGASVPVTVIHVESARVVAKKEESVNGYSAIQITVGDARADRVSKAEAGHFAKSGVAAGRLLKEFRLPQSEVDGFEVGGEIGLEVFEEGQKVDVTGTTIGKGFAGAVKRHNFHMQDATHGNSLSHRAPGSIGQNQTPGRVFKGKKMAGHMGNVRRTIQNLEVVRIDADKQVILVKGAVPGAEGSDVVVKPALKGKK